MASIMIVDDSPIIRRSLRDMFEALGHRIAEEAVDGRQAVDNYKPGEIDLVTMDIQLPGIDGIEAVRLIRERDPQAVIVMISSVEQRGKVYDAIKLGAKHYIVKPFTEDKVSEVINAVLGLPANSYQAIKQANLADPAQQEEQTSRFAKKRELLKLEVPPLQAMPFELVQKDNRTVLSIQRHINESNVRFLHGCLQGLLYYRKAKYVLELWEPVQHDEGLKLILDFIQAIRGRNGTVGVVAADFSCYTQMQAKLRSGVYRSYADIEW